MLHTSGRIDERACSFIRDKKARGRKLRNMPAGRRLRWSNSASHISGHVRACCVSERSIYLSLRFALDRNLSASLDIKSLWFDKLFLQKKRVHGRKRNKHAATNFVQRCHSLKSCGRILRGTIETQLTNLTLYRKECVCVYMCMCVKRPMIICPLSSER
jgi:hypothetical protein